MILTSTESTSAWQKSAYFRDSFWSFSSSHPPPFLPLHFLCRWHYQHITVAHLQQIWHPRGAVCYSSRDQRTSCSWRWSSTRCCGMGRQSPLGRPHRTRRLEGEATELVLLSNSRKTFHRPFYFCWRGRSGLEGAASLNGPFSNFFTRKAHQTIKRSKQNKTVR